jgi:hypothetical protein
LQLRQQVVVEVDFPKRFPRKVFHLDAAARLKLAHRGRRQLRLERENLVVFAGAHDDLPVRNGRRKQRDEGAEPRAHPAVVGLLVEDDLLVGLEHIDALHEVDELALFADLGRVADGECVEQVEQHDRDEEHEEREDDEVGGGVERHVGGVEFAGEHHEDTNDGDAGIAKVLEVVGRFGDVAFWRGLVFWLR